MTDFNVCLEVCMEMFMSPQMKEVQYVNRKLKNNKIFKEYQWQIIAMYELGFPLLAITKIFRKVRLLK